MSFATDKAAILNLLKARNCRLAVRLNTTLSSYDDMLVRLFERSREFDCDPAYLNSLCSALDDAVLVAMGVHYNKTGPIVNPKLIVGGTPTVTIQTGGRIDNFMVAGGANISLITITNNTYINYMEVMGGSTVTKIDVAMGSRIGELHVSKCDTVISTVSKITEQSYIGDITLAEDGAIFGGVECPVFAADTTCSEEVSGITASFSDQNFTILSWNNPTNSVARRVFFRLKGTVSWEQLPPGAGTSTNIGFAGSSKTYEVRIQNKCSASSDWSNGVVYEFTTPNILNPSS